MADNSSKRFKVKPLWVATFLILICVGLFFYQLLGPNPAIVVSKATTHITAPLDEKGLPDYEAYWLQQATEGVTPENNAAVLLWQALWPGDLDEQHWLPLCDALGMEDIPSQETSLEAIYSREVTQQVADWLAEQHDRPEGVEQELWLERLRDETANELTDEAIHCPWTGHQIPPLAKWVEKNRVPLDWLVEGASRSHYYSPSPSLLDGSRQGLLSMLLPDIQNMRTASRGLGVPCG